VDPGCLPPNPDSYPSRISDPRVQKQQQKKGAKKVCCHTVPFFVATNFTKLKLSKNMGLGVKKAPDLGSATMQNYEAIWAYLACGSSWRDDFSYDAVGQTAADSQRRRTA